jgi:hypothetical protein
VTAGSGDFAVTGCGGIHEFFRLAFYRAHAFSFAPLIAAHRNAGCCALVRGARFPSSKIIIAKKVSISIDSRHNDEIRKLLRVDRVA